MEEKNDDELLKIKSKEIFKLDLALEDYEDDTNNDIPLLNEINLKLKDFRKTKDSMSIDEQLKKSDDILKKFNDVLDLIGRENFIFYEDGDINYIWKGGQKNE